MKGELESWMNPWDKTGKENPMALPKPIKFLIPEGRDRDKLIYLKKGGGKLLSNSGHLHYLCPYYSTNRNDAWELWDELPFQKSFSAYADGTYSVCCNENFDKDGEPEKGFIYMDGVSFADAVSKAWLNWYYNIQLKK